MSTGKSNFSFGFCFITIYILLLNSLDTYAQSDKRNFIGCIIDAETNQPVSYATVRLLSFPDSTMLTGGVTDDKGKFQLTLSNTKMSKMSSLLLHASFVGYKAVFHTIPVSSRVKVCQLENIFLSPEGYVLGETVIVGQAPMVVTEQDTTVFNASAYRTPESSILEDLVKQLPGAMIEKLKVYERQSDLSRLTGVDDGEEEMILDLSVKKDMKQGWRENFTGGVGSKERYELANILNRFRDNSQLTVIGNLNNTNNQGFSELQKETSNSNANVRSGNGLTTSRSLGVNATYNWEHVEFRTNVQYLNTDRLEDNRMTIDNFLRQDKSITKSSNNSRMKNHNLTANAFLEWKIDSVTTMIFRPQYDLTNGERGDNGIQKGWTNDSLLNEKVSSGTNHTSRYNVSMMLQFSRKLSRMGRNIAIKVDYGTNASTIGKRALSTT